MITKFLLMKKRLIFLYLLMLCTITMVQAQTVYINIPDVVCMSTTNSTSDQAKFTSILAVVQGGGITVTEQATWELVVNATRSLADLEVLHTDNAAATTKADKLKNTRSLTLQFLVPGTYTFDITMPYTTSAGAPAEAKRRVTIRAEDCTISTCSGGAGRQGFKEDFGTMDEGVTRRKYPVDGVVLYTYQPTGELQDEYYAISNTTRLKGDWADAPDHTGNYRGAMLVANSSVTPRQFYKKTVTDLCPGSIYNFSAWLMNLNTIGALGNVCLSNYQYAGVTFKVVDAANESIELASFKTNAVSMMLGASGPTWQRYGGTFVVPSNVQSVVVYIINDKPGGCGNDIAIDDIEFSYCSPIIVAGIEGEESSLREVLCEGAPITLTSSFVPATYFVNPAYQWEMSDDEGLSWVNVPYGTSTSPRLVIEENELKGTRTVSADYLFRVRIYENGSDITTCASPSTPVRLTILPMPTLYLTKSQVCAGTIVELEASGGFDTYSWSDLPGYTGTTRQITVDRDMVITVYGYVNYGDGHTCVDENSTAIYAVDAPVVEVATSATSICVGGTVELRINSVLAQHEIKWFLGPDVNDVLTPLPEYDGMTTINHQILSAADSVYTVTVRDLANICEVSSAPIKVNITEIPVADAGTDQITCASTNSSGNFTMNAPPLPAGLKGTWKVGSISGPGVSSGTVDNDDYVRIINAAVPTTRITLKKPGITVQMNWVVQSTTNTACEDTKSVYLSLIYDPSYSDAGPDTIQCGTNNVFTMNASQPNETLTDLSAETGTWTLISGNATIADIHAYNTTVTAHEYEEDIVLSWTITNAAGCSANVDEVILHKTKQPSVTLNAPVTTCNTTGSFELDTVATTGHPIIFNITTGTNAMPGFTPVMNLEEPTWPLTVSYPADVAPGTYDFILSFRSAPAGCDSTTVFQVNVESGPIAPTGITVSDPGICGTATITLTVAGGDLGKKADGTDNAEWVWYEGDCETGTVVGNGTSITQTVSATTTYSVRAESTGACGNTACVSTEVTVHDEPEDADAGVDQSTCEGNDFIMAANVPAAGTTGTWTVVSGTATIRTGEANLATATISVQNGTIAVLRWTLNNEYCEKYDEVTLTSIPMPTTANAGVPIEHCNDAVFNMAGNTPVIGTGLWTVPAGSGATITNPTSANAVINVPVGSSVTATWTISNSTCTSTSDVLLTNNIIPAAANAGADQIHCDDAQFTMTATAASPTTATGTWSIVSGTGTVAAPNNPASIVTVTAGNTVTLRWTITNGICSSATDDVTLTNQVGIQGNTITADQVLCANQTPAALSGGIISGGSGTYTYQWQISTTNATTGFVNVTTGVGGTNAIYTPANITQNTWFRRVVMSGACTNNISNAVMLTLMNTPPVVISVPGAVTADCVSGTDYTTRFGTPVFSHAPYTGEALTITYNDVTVNVDACTFTIMRTWTATDRCGLTTQAQQTITVVDRTAPVFAGTAPANVTVDCANVPAAVTLTANDACGGPMTITPTEERVDAPGACSSNYQLIRRWVAVDACGNASNTLIQTITVRDITAPVFNGTAPANITVECDNIPAGVPMTATDNCTPGVITVVPVDVRRTISGSRCASNYQIVRTWTATDLCGNTTVLTQTITVQDNTPPVFSVIVPPNITVECDNVPSVESVTATDNCTAAVTVRVAERKEFLSSCTNNYRLTRTWTASDDCGNTNTMTQVILVQDITPPVFTVTPPADETVSCDAIPAPPTNLRATDNCGTVRISYTQTREEIAGACVGSYRLIRIWTATDGCNNATVHRQVLTVVDMTAPVIDPAPVDVTIACGGTIPAAATLYARDNCDATFPKRATMVQDAYTVDICGGYTIIRRWTASDVCGNAAIERVQRITVSPCPKPALDPNLPVNCSNNTKFAILLLNKVSKPTFTLVSVTPATAVATPLTQTSNVFDLRGATSATFTVRDGVTGCVSDPVTYNLQYNAKPVVDLGPDVAICRGYNVTLDAGAANTAYTIRWSNGTATQTITVSAAGTYWATVSNGLCATTDSIKVSVNNPPVVNLRDTAICDGESVRLNAYVQGASYVWSTGETTAAISVNMQGTYSVDVSLNGCVTHAAATVTIGIPPSITLTPDAEICPDETVMLTVDPDGGNVLWNTGERSNSIVVSRPGDYWVTVTRNGCVVTEKVTVRLKSALNIDLGPNRDICIGGRVMLDASNPDAVSYLWNDGEITPIREITTPGKYVVSVMDRFCSAITMDSVNVTVAGITGIELGNDTTLCIGETLTLKVDAGTGNSIRWQDGSTTASYTVTTAGYYTVTVYNECGSVSDRIAVTYQVCETKPQFPNAFTPNGDGKNDTFKPDIKGLIYDYDLRIFNRWGEIIFLSKDAKTGWDGRYKGKLVENGTYVWILSYKKKTGGSSFIQKGSITVLR
jgi:gliding motility-associated-like protein